MKEVEVNTHSVKVYIAGDVEKARDSLRRQCFEEGLCVTLTPTDFIYTGGMESGVVVGFVNYPRFPTTLEALFARAIIVAKQLMNDLYQNSVLIVGDRQTKWISRRAE
jgi:hypothetical protein